MSHTPGPWEVYGPVDLDYWIIYRYPNGYDQHVATAHWNHPEDYSVVLNNAHLIAAAPDMLEALEYAIAQVPELASVPGIEVAIRKARGEEC
jgi:hypothetical protein